MLIIVLALCLGTSLFVALRSKGFPVFVPLGYECVQFYHVGRGYYLYCQNGWNCGNESGISFSGAAITNMVAISGCFDG
ncbi:hypothetical protein [Flavonifractor plautii]|uniref:hypothetical protein n=1 Tax=Flavonifractor plautii TaxID=292800 RepID=UPI003EED7C90